MGVTNGLSYLSIRIQPLSDSQGLGFQNYEQNISHALSA